MAAVGLVTAAQGNLFWLGGAPSNACGTPSSGPTPLGTSLAFNEPQEEVRGANHWYNFSVQSAAGGVVWGDLVLAAVTSTGGNITATALWTAGAWSWNGTGVATYEFASTTWLSGGNAPVASSQTLVFDSGTTDLSNGGDAMNIFFQSTCLEGSVQIQIP